MILFIFEGKKQEPRLYQTMKHLFFNNSQNEDIQVSYCSNIYSLYNKIQKELNIFDGVDDATDIIDVLRNVTKDKALLNYKGEFSQVFLFFDYDIKKIDNKNKLTLNEQNKRIREMLEYFNNETENGKLYINYPMAEAIRYFKKELPDKDFYKYKINVYCNGHFKKIVADISFYNGMRFICFDYNAKTKRIKIPKDGENIKAVKNNWLIIKDLSVKKANFICTGLNKLPIQKSDISQINIFKAQVEKCEESLQKEIYILSAFPLFLYEFFK